MNRRRLRAQMELEAQDHRLQHTESSMGCRRSEAYRTSARSQERRDLFRCLVVHQSACRCGGAAEPDESRDEPRQPQHGAGDEDGGDRAEPLTWWRQTTSRTRVQDRGSRNGADRSAPTRAVRAVRSTGSARAERTAAPARPAAGGRASSARAEVERGTRKSQGYVSGDKNQTKDLQAPRGEI